MTDIPDKSSTFVLILTGLLGGLFGLIIGIANGLGVWGLVIGSLLAILVSFIGISFSQNERKIKYIICALLVIGFFYYLGPIGILLGVSIGWFFGWFLFWLFHKRYRANLQPYLSQGQVLWHYTFRIICGVIFVFLITPILVVMPLSFNAQDFFTFTPEMLQFDPEGYSLKHYRDFFTNKINS